MPYDMQGVWYDTEQQMQQAHGGQAYAQTQANLENAEQTIMRAMQNQMNQAAAQNAQTLGQQTQNVQYYQGQGGQRYAGIFNAYTQAPPQRRQTVMDALAAFMIAADYGITEMTVSTAMYAEICLQNGVAPQGFHLIIPTPYGRMTIHCEGLKMPGPDDFDRYLEDVDANPA